MPVVFFCLGRLAPGMSDFDREAERERLREKYEADKRDRRSTQRMSELLLKGATMTNRHCEECGDPIFRHDGTEFCPTCRHEGDSSDASEADGADAGGDADAGAGRPADADVGPDAGVDANAGAASDASDTGRPANAGSPTDGTTADGTPDAGASDVPATPDRAGGGRKAGGDAARTPEAPAGSEGNGRAAARASLERTLVRFARTAEGTDDPRRARDLLAAAREAAEALAALERR